MAPIRESAIEAALTKAIKAAGGLCWKWTSPGTNGVPDRIVMLPGKPVVFVELKAPGRKPTPLQFKRHAEIRSTGNRVEVIDSKEKVWAFVQELIKG